MYIQPGYWDSGNFEDFSYFVSIVLVLNQGDIVAVMSTTAINIICRYRYDALSYNICRLSGIDTEFSQDISSVFFSSGHMRAR